MLLPTEITWSLVVLISKTLGDIFSFLIFVSEKLYSMLCVIIYQLRDIDHCMVLIQNGVSYS